MKPCIFVGPDGVGKTALTELVAKVLRDRAIRYQLVTPPASLDKFERGLKGVGWALREVTTWTDSEGGLLIYDRFPIPDEFIYNDNMNTLSMLDAVYQMIEVSGSVRPALVYMTYSDIDAVSEINDPEVGLGRLKVIYHLYERWFERFAEYYNPVIKVTRTYFEEHHAKILVDTLLGLPGFEEVRRG